MTGIPVSIAPPTAEGRLHPRYLNGIGILTLESDTRRPCPHYVNIDGSLILDFDERRVLAAVELLIPISGWKGKDDTARPSGAPGDVLLAASAPASSDYEWPVIVSKNVQTDEARIAFGSGAHDRSVALSNACHALLLGDRLTGFWFSLAR
jgi:hypothetical protein